MSADLADDDVAKPDLIGEVLANRYQIESHLGEGAMGSVFKAKHVKVGRPFAVKVLHKKLVADRKILQRFEREAELAGRLRHPNVIGVVDVGETTDGFRYMVMDFAAGHDLATLLNEAPMPPARVINLTRQMLEGLFHAHEQGLIHRDFKPENVIIEKDDHGVEVPRIVDFGIAILRDGGDSTNANGRLTTNGLVLGTPHYMAPEQAVADPIDHRIDLFALGIVVYEMLSGKLPFDGTGAEVARANLLLAPPVISQRVPYLEVDPLLEAFARRMMAKKRELRPATAKAARELLDLITSDPQAAAAALGVPLVASSRSPSVTQPSAPVTGDLAVPRSARAATSAPVAELEAPPFSRAESVSEPIRQRSIRTDVAEPLTYDDAEEPPKRSNKLVLMALGAVGALGLILFIATRGGGKPEEPKPPASPIVVKADPPKQPEDPKQPDPPKEEVTQVVDPIVEPPKRPGEGSAKPPVVVKKPEIVKKPVIVKRPEAGSAKPPELPADLQMTKQDVLTASALYSLYQAVGSDLARVAKIDAPLAADVEQAYRRIQIQDAMASEASRSKNGAELQRLARRLAAAKPEKP